MKTMSLILPTVVLCLICLVCTTGAHAQAGSHASSQISLRAGLSAPSSGAAREVRSRYLVAGASYGVKPSSGTASTSEVYLDYVGASGGGKTVTVWGLGFSGRSPLSKSAASASGGMKPFLEVGGGYYFGKTSGGDAQKKNGLGTRLDIGLDFSNRFFGQVGYALLPKLGDINPSGFRVQIGLRL